MWHLSEKLALIPGEGVHEYYSEFFVSPKERERRPKTFEDALDILIARKATCGRAFDNCIIALMKLEECMRKPGLDFAAPREHDYCVAELMAFCRPDPSRIQRGIRMLQERSVQCVSAGREILESPSDGLYANSFRLFRKFLDHGTSSAATSSTPSVPYVVPQSATLTLRFSDLDTMKLVKDNNTINEFRDAAMEILSGLDTGPECQPPTVCSDDEILCWLAPWLISKYDMIKIHNALRKESLGRLAKGTTTSAQSWLELDHENEIESMRDIIYRRSQKIADENRNLKKIESQHARESKRDEKPDTDHPIIKRRKKH